MSQGKQVAVTEWENPVVHQYVHEDNIRSPEIQALGLESPIFQANLDHLRKTRQLRANAIAPPYEPEAPPTGSAPKQPGQASQAKSVEAMPKIPGMEMIERSVQQLGEMPTGAGAP